MFTTDFKPIKEGNVLVFVHIHQFYLSKMYSVLNYSCPFCGTLFNDELSMLAHQVKNNCASAYLVRESLASNRQAFPAPSTSEPVRTESVENDVAHSDDDTNMSLTEVAEEVQPDVIMEEQSINEERKFQILAILIYTLQTNLFHQRLKKKKTHLLSPFYTR